MTNSEFKGKRALSRSIQGSIVRRTFFIIGVCLILPLLLYDLWKFYRGFETQMSVTHQELALTSEAMALYLDEKLSNVETQFSRLGALIETNPEDVETYLQLFSHQDETWKFLRSPSPSEALSVKAEGSNLIFSKGLLELSIPKKTFQNPLQPKNFSMRLLNSNQEVILQEGQEFKKAATLTKDLSDGQLKLEIHQSVLTPRALFEERLTHFITLATLFLLIGGGFALFFMRKISKPLDQLMEVMGRASDGDLEANYTKGRWGFEINHFGEELNAMLASLKDYMLRYSEEKAQKLAYEQELKLGYEVQMSLFPKSLPDLPDIKVATTYLPAREVGGDFYDLFKVGDKVAIAIGDGSGKGIFACFYSLLLRSYLRSTLQAGHSLQEAIMLTNWLFLEDTKESGAFVTAFVALYDPTSREIEYVNTGHPPPLLKRASGEVELCAAEGMALGVLPLENVVVKRKQLEKGDLLLLYTDGITESFSPSGELFGEARLIDLIKKAPSEQLTQEIQHAISGFTSSAPLSDDITLLALQM